MPAILHTWPTVNSRSTTRLATLTSSSSSDCRLATVPPSLASWRAAPESGSIATCFLYSASSADALEQSRNQSLVQYGMMSGQRLRDLVEDRGIVDGRRNAVLRARRDRPHGAAQDLAGAGLRQPRDDPRVAEHRHRADLLAHQL